MVIGGIMGGLFGGIGVKRQNALRAIAAAKIQKIQNLVTELAKENNLSNEAVETIMRQTIIDNVAELTNNNFDPSSADLSTAINLYTAFADVGLGNEVGLNLDLLNSTLQSYTKDLDMQDETIRNM